MFKFNYTLNEEDYVNFYEYHFFNSNNGKKSFLLLRLVPPLISCFLVFIFLVIRADAITTIIVAIAMTCSSITWIIFLKKIMLKSLKNNIMYLKKEGNLPFGEGVTLVFGEKSFTGISPESETTTEYSVLEKTCVSDKAVYIYAGSIPAYIIPLSCFSTETEKQSFLDFINSKITGEKHATQA